MSDSHPPAGRLAGVERLAARAMLPSGVLLAAGCATWLLLVQQAPLDSMQGEVQKILYVHVPVVMGAYLGFFCTAIGGALYLWRREAHWDRFAASSAEIGVLFCTLVLVTGPIWAKGTWGRWWAWDLRLILSTLLFLVYVSYLLLRSFTEGSERTARFAAVYGIAGVALIPLNYFAIQLAEGRSIHPENLERGSLGDGMGWPFLVGSLTALVAFVHLLCRRIELARLSEQLTERELEEGEPAWDT